MNIISLKSEASGNPLEKISRVELSDGSLFSFRNCYLPREMINSYLTDDDLTIRDKAGSEITAYEEAAFRHASACLRTEKTALRLIARAEQCVTGISRKLEKRGLDAACVRDVIERLISLQLLDDARFARLWLESRLRLPRSPRRLFAALCSRGIGREEAESALKNILDDDTEYALLLRFAKKITRKKKNPEESDKRPLKYLFKNEGFSHTVIQRFFETE